MRIKLRDVVIRRAESSTDLEALYRFRYAIYVEEMGRPQRYADHVRRCIEEPLDATAANFIAIKDDAIVGCVRWNSGQNTDFGEYIALYEMHRAGACFPKQCGITTKLMVDAAHRRSVLPVLLCRAGYTYARHQGLLVDFMDCNSHLEEQFAQFGYRSYRDRIEHPEYGDVLPMVLLCPDLEHLQRVRSPLTDIEAACPRAPDTVAALHQSLGLNGSAHRATPTNSVSLPHTTKRIVHMKPNPPIVNFNTVLQQALDTLVQDIEQTGFYKTITSPEADRSHIAEVFKHIYLSIYQYQPHVTEATFNAVGRMPKHSEKLIKKMIIQQVEEVEHADMALRDYLRLGGDKALAEGPIFPECAAVAAMCHFLGGHCHPAAYLGFMYIFEALTPIMATKAQEVMGAANYLPEAREFVDLHATEDIRHTNMILAVIEEVVANDPAAADAILFGLRAFTSVYPIPVWSAAHARARAA
jgi:hypothetical protein